MPRGHGARSDWTLKGDPDWRATELFSPCKTPQLQGNWRHSLRLYSLWAYLKISFIKFTVPVFLGNVPLGIDWGRTSNYRNTNVILMHRCHLVCFVLAAAGCQVKANALESTHEMQILQHLVAMCFISKFGRKSKSREKCGGKLSYEERSLLGESQLCFAESL